MQVRAGHQEAGGVRVVQRDDGKADAVSTESVAMLDLLDVPTVVVGRDCTIAFFNRAASEAVGLTTSDIGRPASKISALTEMKDFEKWVAQVIADATPYQHEIRDGDRRFVLRLAPYTAKDPSGGAVLTFTNVTAFRESLEKAIYEREYTKTILNAVRDSLVVLDSDLAVQTANRTFYEMFGVSREGTQGVPLCRLGNQEWKDSGLWESLEAMLSAGKEFKTREIERDFPVLGRRTLLVDARRLSLKSDAAILLTFQDITDRKRDEQTICRIKDFHEAITSNMGEGLYTIDGDGRVTSMNPAAEKLFGWKLSELQGRKMHEVTHYLHRDGSPFPAEECAGLQVLRHGKSLANHEDTFIHKDGTFFDVEYSSSPIYEGDDIAGLVVVFRDISDRKRTEEVKARLAAIVESSDDAIIGKDLNSVITNWNAAAERIFGYSAQEALGQPITILMAAEHFNEEQGILDRILRGERIEPYETVRLHKDGRLLDISLTVSPVLDGNGKVVGASKIARDISARRQIERALSASEQRYRSLLALLPASVYTCEAPSGIITFYNEHAARSWGRAPKVGDTDQRFCGSFKLWRPDGTFLPHESTPMAVALRENRAFRNEEVIIERPDGTRITVLVNIDPICDGNSNVVGAINVFHDTTALKEAEKALRNRSKQFETLLNQAPLGVYLVDADFCIREANPVAIPVFGDIPGGIIGRDFDEVIHLLWEKPYADEIVRIFRHTLETGKPYITQERAQHRLHRGITEYYEWRVDRIPLPDGRFGLVCYFRDISAQVQAREAIAQSEARLRQVADAMPQMVWAARPDGYVDYYNERWYEYTGFPRGEFGQSSWEKILHPDDVQRCVETYFSCIREGRPYQIEYRFKVRNSQEYRWFMGRALPIRDERGEIVRWFGTCTDIDDQKRAQDELRSADRRKDEFLATLAHELRNPLAPIRNSLQIMRMTGDSSPAVEHVREIMERQVAHMVRLVDDLLELSRVSRGTIELKKERIELKTIVAHAVEASKPMIDAAHHQLAVSLPTESLFVEGDSVRLSQVFANLLNNAAKYTEDGGNITVNARREETTAIISIRDSGVGIPPDMLSRVSDMFAQVDNVLRRSQDGLGIGLNLVRTLLAMHGGSIEAHSDGLDQGSEFVVRLPLAEPQWFGPETDVIQDDHQTSVAPVLRILVVDDNRDSADSLGMLLRFLGTDVQVTYDGQSALEKLFIFRPSVLLLDIGMPGLDGYEVARRVRKNPQFSEVVLIALTGWGQEEDRIRTRDAGFDHHLVKPVEPAVLQELLVSLGGPSRRDALERF